MQHSEELKATIHDLVRQGRGILAADESAPAISRRFKAINMESTEEHRRVWLGKTGHAKAAQQALLKRARLSHLPMQGQYQPALETE